jgi:hypothetical protein
MQKKHDLTRFDFIFVNPFTLTRFDSFFNLFTLFLYVWSFSGLLENNFDLFFNFSRCEGKTLQLRVKHVFLYRNRGI